MILTPPTRRAFALLVAATAAAVPALGQAPSTTNTLAAQRASCVLRVETDEGRYSGGQQPSQTIVAMLTSTALVDPAMRDALNLDPAAWPEVAQVDVQPAGESAVKLTVIVRPTAQRPIAEPAAAAVRARDALTRRALRAYNGNAATRPDDRSAAIADLQRQRAEIDAKLMALRNEMTTAGERQNRLMIAGREPTRSAFEQQLSDLRAEVASQEATIATIDEQVPKLPAEPAAEIASLRTKLLGQQIDARIAIAKARVRIAQFTERLAAFDREAAVAATQPVRSTSIVQNEMNELSARRSEIDQQLAQLSNRRDVAAPRGRLVVLDGGEGGAR